VYEGTFYLLISNEISWREISNGVNYSLNKDFMWKLQVKHWRVNFETQLTSEDHNILFQNHIEEHENSTKEKKRVKTKIWAHKFIGEHIRDL
jgi:hypothetical protein